MVGFLGSNTCLLDGIGIEYKILDDPTRWFSFGRFDHNGA